MLLWDTYSYFLFSSDITKHSVFTHYNLYHLATVMGHCCFSCSAFVLPSSGETPQFFSLKNSFPIISVCVVRWGGGVSFQGKSEIFSAFLDSSIGPRVCVWPKWVQSADSRKFTRNFWERDFISSRDGELAEWTSGISRSHLSGVKGTCLRRKPTWKKTEKRHVDR